MCGVVWCGVSVCVFVCVVCLCLYDLGPLHSLTLHMCASMHGMQAGGGGNGSESVCANECVYNQSLLVGISHAYVFACTPIDHVPMCVCVCACARL